MTDKTMEKHAKAFVCEPLKDGVKVIDRIKELKPKSVMLIFWHGVGDAVMFLRIMEQLQFTRELCHIKFTVGLPGGLGIEELMPPDVKWQLIDGEECNKTTEDLPFDLVCKITFPMSEGQTKYTKAEWSLIEEFGLDPKGPWISHSSIARGTNRLIGVHLQATALPGPCNVPHGTSEQIWKEIEAAGFIPIETHFEHIFHNPVNKKPEFVKRHVRNVTPKISTLIGLLQSCAGFLGVSSGNFHVAMSCMSPDTVAYLKKDYDLKCYTRKEGVSQIDVKNYEEGSVTKWLNTLI